MPNNYQRCCKSRHACYKWEHTFIRRPNVTCAEELFTTLQLMIQEKLTLIYSFVAHTQNDDIRVTSVMWAISIVLKFIHFSHYIGHTNKCLKSFYKSVATNREHEQCLVYSNESRCSMCFHICGSVVQWLSRLLNTQKVNLTLTE